MQNDRAVTASVEVLTTLFDAAGASVFALRTTETIAAGASHTFKFSSVIPSPRFWEPDYPHLYNVSCTVISNSVLNGHEVVDSTTVPLGVRAAHWDAAAGLFLNGSHLKLHGWGQKPTDEWPGLGAAQPDWLHFYTLDLMKRAGGNFVRWGHSATGPASIAAGDRLGIIALQPGTDGESDTVKAAWKLRASAFRDMIIYFRNHPSILIWEGGNQKVTREHAAELRGYMDTYDPHGGRAYAHRRADQITAEFMDVGVGTEGGREIARLPVVEGEYDREESPRRVWDDASPPNFGYPEAKGMTYQLTSEQFAVNEVSQWIKKLGAPEHSGGANWIFSDSTSGGRVPAEVARAGGEADGVRLPKEAYYVCAAMWRADPQVHIIGHWTYPAGTKKNVFVASNADDVELFVNGTSLGHGKVSDKYLFTFADVVFAPGEIKAIAKNGGRIVATHLLRSAGPAVALKITPLTSPGGFGLRADGGDIALLDVEAVDAKGERCPTFQARADFEITGPAVWRGGYNSGKINSTNNTFLDLEAGVNRVALRATHTAGKIVVRVRSEGLRDASVTIESRTFDAFAAEHGYSVVMPAAPAVKLPAVAPTHAAFSSDAPAAKVAAKSAAMLGKFIKTFSYTGPNATIMHVEVNARDGRNIYVDRDYTFTALPPALVGADWLQLPDDDQRYSAVDLVQLSAAGGTAVTIAHDERAPLPAWLTKQFQPTDQSLAINGKPMKLFTHRAAQDESLTFGSNTDGAPVRANQYVVFVNAAK